MNFGNTVCPQAFQTRPVAVPLEDLAGIKTNPYQGADYVARIVAVYAARGPSALPPICLWPETCSDQPCGYRLADGNHRLAAARLAGLREILACISRVPPERAPKVRFASPLACRRAHWVDRILVSVATRLLEGIAQRFSDGARAAGVVSQAP